MEAVFQVTDSWSKSFPGAHVGILVMRNVSNPPRDATLEDRKRALEDHLRELYGGATRSRIQNHPVIAAYMEYYKRFGKTYHVRLQLESVVLKGKPIASPAALVQAMFMAELKNMLLTAGHDLDWVRTPIEIDASQGKECYELLCKKDQALKPGDMIMRDREGVISSILYGPDRRTRIRPETQNVVFAVYVPVGISQETILNHLCDIEANVRIIAPQARVERIHTFG